MSARPGTSSPATAVAAREETDNDAAEADDGADETCDDTADAVDDSHDAVSDGSEGWFDLQSVGLVGCFLLLFLGESEKEKGLHKT